MHFRAMPILLLLAVTLLAGAARADVSVLRGQTVIPDGGVDGMTVNDPSPFHLAYIIRNDGDARVLLAAPDAVILSDLTGCVVSVAKAPPRAVPAGGAISFRLRVEPESVPFHFRVAVHFEDARAPLEFEFHGRAALDHPRIGQEWFTTILLRWDEGLVVYDRWLLNTSGVARWPGGGGAILLDFYYLCYLIAFIGVLFFFHRFRRQGWIKVRPHVAYDAMLLAMVGVLVGAKTVYIFIYNPDFYFGPPPYGPLDSSDQLSRIFLNWSGMASHGAAFGCAVVVLLWWLKTRRTAPMGQIADIGCISAAFGVMWIRLANFMNGELYGRESSAPWAMRFPVRSGQGNDVVWHNHALYERMIKPEDPEYARVWLENLNAVNPDGVIDRGGYVLYKNADAYQQGYEVIARMQDGVKTMVTDDPGHILWGDFTVVTTPRHPSQLYQLILEGLLILILLLWLRRRVTRGGMVAAAFFIAYPVARFIGEFFRQPDVQFQDSENVLGTIFFGLSMGQILSLAMATLGVSAFFYFRRHGKIIAEQKLWPPDPNDPDQQNVLTVPYEKGTGGSSAAGDIGGLPEIRAALAEKELEWDEQARAEIDKPADNAEKVIEEVTDEFPPDDSDQEAEHDRNKADPDQPEGPGRGA